MRKETKNTGNITIIIFLFSLFGCSKPVNDLYTSSSVESIQENCNENIKSWIKAYASFPDSYIPLQFERIKISSSYIKAAEIMPLRRYNVEHTFVIRTNENYNTHATLVFELTPDYFVQDVRYRQTGTVSLESRVYPPKYELWTELYGRPLTKNDTLGWKENNREILYHLFESFHYNRYVNPEGENAALADSLVKQMNKFYRTQ